LYLPHINFNHYINWSRHNGNNQRKVAEHISRIFPKSITTHQFTSSALHSLCHGKTHLSLWETKILCEEKSVRSINRQHTYSLPTLVSQARGRSRNGFTNHSTVCFHRNVRPLREWLKAGKSPNKSICAIFSSSLSLFQSVYCFCPWNPPISHPLHILQSQKYPISPFISC
jgi:hypothetical protein